MLSLPGFEIDFVHRKVYCGNQEVNLTAKDYALLCLLVANEGFMTRYTERYGKKKYSAVRIMPLSVIFRIYVKNYGK